MNIYVLVEEYKSPDNDYLSPSVQVCGDIRTAVSLVKSRICELVQGSSPGDFDAVVVAEMAAGWEDCDPFYLVEAWNKLGCYQQLTLDHVEMETGWEHPEFPVAFKPSGD
jgi:hypothetical protein